MKKIFAMVILAVMLMASSAWAVAGSCVQTGSALSSYVYQVKLVCTGDSTNGTLPTQTIATDTMAILTGNYYLYTVTAYKTVGGTAPDAADVAVLMSGMDLLGAKGVNLIHASATYDTMPYSAFMASYRYPMITNALTLTVANQATVSATWTIDLLFVR
jgi:hypothetical protein